MSRMSNDLFEIGEMAHHGPEDVFIAVMTLIGSFVLMLTINWKLACLTFAIIPFLIWLVVVCNKRMTQANHRMFTDIADFNGRVEDTFGGIRVVQAFANEGFEQKRFAVNNQRFRTTKLIAYRIMALNSSVSYMLMRLVTVFVLICGAWFVIRGAVLWRTRRLHFTDERVLQADRQDQCRHRELSEGDRGLQALPSSS